MTAMTHSLLTLEEHRAAFSGRRALAMPLSGMIAWSVIGIGSTFLDPFQSSLLLFIATGSIVYLAMFISRFTGENFFRGFGNPFDRLFFVGLFMALLVYAIAIPFFLADYRSITLTVGILTGLMWMPFSWIVQHWIGYFHAVARTLLIVAVWYLWPELHFQLIPAIIVGMYLVTIVVLEQRWSALQR
jgi:hypothetical protein